VNRCVQQRDETLSAWASHPVRPAPAKVGPVGAPVTNYGRALLERWRAQFWMTEPLYTIASLGVALSVAVAGLPVVGVDLAARSSERLRTAPSGQRDRDQADDRLRCCLQRRADARPIPFTMPPTSAVDVPGPAHDQRSAHRGPARQRARNRRARVYLFLRFLAVRGFFVADCAPRCSRTACFVAAVFSFARAISLAVISADFLAVSSWSDSFFRRTRTSSSCSGRTQGVCAASAPVSRSTN